MPATKWPQAFASLDKRHKGCIYKYYALAGGLSPVQTDRSPAWPADNFRIRATQRSKTPARAFAGGDGEMSKRRAPPSSALMQNTALESDGSGFGPVSNLQLRDYILDVEFGCAFGHAQHTANLLVAQTLDQKIEHLALAVR
jgi:hypothetical protein